MGGCHCQKLKENTLVVELDGITEFNSEKTKAINFELLDKPNANPIDNLGNSNENNNMVSNYSDSLKKIKKKVVKSEGLLNNKLSINDIFINSKQNIVPNNCNLDKKEFVNSLFFEYNLVRSNPQFYAEKIRSHLKYIKEKNKKYYYETEDQKVVLSKGNEYFIKAIDFLMLTKPVPLLQLVEDLALEIKSEMDAQGINQILKDRMNEYCKYNIDISGKNAETSCILQLVDDTNNKGARRDNILNPFFRYVGISLFKGKGRYYNVYSTFSM